MYRLCALIILFSIANSVHAKETLKWAIPDFPPWYITKGDQKGQGLTDRLIDYFIQQMPEYEHQKVHMNFARYTVDATSGQQVCMANLLKRPDREEVMHFSIVNAIGLPQRIIMLSDRADALGLKDEVSVSFRSLFENQDLSASFEQNRIYFNDPLIQEATSTNPRHMINAISSERLFQMMAINRIDYIIEHPGAAKQLSDKFDVDIKSFAIEESGPYIAAYVTCSKTEWGAQVIQRVNEAIKKGKQGNIYKNIMLEMKKNFDQNSAEAYENLFYMVFLKMDT